MVRKERLEQSKGSFHLLNYPLYSTHIHSKKKLIFHSKVIYYTNFLLTYYLDKSII